MSMVLWIPVWIAGEWREKAFWRSGKTGFFSLPLLEALGMSQRCHGDWEKKGPALAENITQSFVRSHFLRNRMRSLVKGDVANCSKTLNCSPFKQNQWLGRLNSGTDTHLRREGWPQKHQSQNLNQVGHFHARKLIWKKSSNCPSNKFCDKP